MMVPTILIARRSSRFLIITILTCALSVTSKHHKNHSTFRAVRIHSSPSSTSKLRYPFNQMRKDTA